MRTLPVHWGNPNKPQWRPGPHHIALLSQEAPGVYEVVCSCGEHTWTPWGAANATEIAALHFWSVGQRGTVTVI